MVYLEALCSSLPAACVDNKPSVRTVRLGVMARSHTDAWSVDAGRHAAVKFVDLDSMTEPLELRDIRVTVGRHLTASVRFVLLVLRSRFTADSFLSAATTVRYRSFDCYQILRQTCSMVTSQVAFAVRKNILTRKQRRILISKSVLYPNF